MGLDERLFYQSNYPFWSGVIIAGLLIFGVFLYVSVSKKVCNRENYDVFYYVKALRTREPELCAYVGMQDLKASCFAETKLNESLCPLTMLGPDSSCLAITRKDINLCRDDVFCKVLITKDSVDCNGLKESDKKVNSVCGAYANLDAEFFISKAQLVSC